MKAPRLLHWLLLLSALAAVGCGAAPGGSEDGAGLNQALDDAPDPDDGKACYQDVPMRKGVMSYGVCCFDDPVKGTSECIICDAAHTCTKGGATPGALTAQTGSIVSAGTLVLSGGSNWKPPNTAVVGTRLTTSATSK
jgi:hypothetical protein